MNSFLVIISIFLYLGTMALLFKLFGKMGLFCWIILATLFANIEVLLNVHAFGLNMSLGNVLFGSSFLATDVLSERYGKKDSLLAMRLGIVTTIIYIVFTQFWLLFTPSTEDFAYGAMNTLFDAAFRVALAGVIVYYIAQKVDIFMYHLIWKKTEEITHDKTKLLWLRNNGSTLVTQLVNNLLFTYLAFAEINIGFIHIEGLYDTHTVISIFITGYIIMAIVALVDTPFCYLCRKMKVKEYV